MGMNEQESVPTVEKPVPTEHLEDDPGEIAAMMVREFSPKFKKLVSEMSTGQLRRLSLALCTYPLEYEDVMGHDDQLKHAYALGDRLIQAKFLLINDIYLTEENKKLQKKEEENGQK